MGFVTVSEIQYSIAFKSAKVCKFSKMLYLYLPYLLIKRLSKFVTVSMIQAIITIIIDYMTGDFLIVSEIQSILTIII